MWYTYHLPAIELATQCSQSGSPTSTQHNTCMATSSTARGSPKLVALSSSHTSAILSQHLLVLTKQDSAHHLLPQLTHNRKMKASALLLPLCYVGSLVWAAPYATHALQASHLMTNLPQHRREYSRNGPYPQPSLRASLLA